MATLEEVYDTARKRMIKDGIPIHPALLRSYLDRVRAISRFRNGYHPVVITVTRDSTRFIGTMDSIPGNAIIRMEGQSWR